jgi:hypothetical protein
MTNYLDIASLDKYAAGVCGRAGLRVVWDTPDSTPRTDNRTIWLPRLTTKATPDDITSLRYYIKHEASHCVHSDFDYLNKHKPLGALALLNNLFEDNRIDYLNDHAYVGDSVTSNAFWTLYAGKIADVDPATLEQKRSVISAFMLDALTRTWIATSHLALSALKMQATDDNLQQLESLLEAGCLDDLVALRQHDDKSAAAEATMQLAKKVFSILFPDADVEAHIEMPSKAPKRASERESGDGEGEGSGKGEKAAVGDSSASDGDMEDRIVEVPRVTTPVPHEHTLSRTGQHMVHELTDGVYVPPTPSEYTILNFPIPSPYPKMGSGFRSRDVTSNIEENGKPMANKLRLKLQTISRGRYEYGHKRGKLHNGSLHRVLQGDTKQAERVFRQHKTTDTLDTVVSLLVDCSGSMSGRKFETACAAAGAMAEALKPLHIAYNVLGFTNDVFKDEQPLVFNFTKFGENVPLHELVKRFEQASNCLWDNSDGDAVVYAYQQLLQRKEHRKVLLVMSDGSPSGRHGHGDIVSYTKQVTTNIYNSKLVDLYGIGIEDSNVKLYYDKYVIVNRGDSLSEKILSIVERSFV